MSGWQRFQKNIIRTQKKTRKMQHAAVWWSLSPLPSSPEAWRVTIGFPGINVPSCLIFFKNQFPCTRTKKKKTNLGSDFRENCLMSLLSWTWTISFRSVLHSVYTSVYASVLQNFILCTLLMNDLYTFVFIIYNFSD